MATKSASDIACPKVLTEIARLPLGRERRERRQSGGRQGHHEDPLREVAEPHRPREVALRPGPELREEAPGEDEVDVVDADAEHHREHAPAHVDDARIAQVEDRAARVAEASQRRPLGDDLQEAAQERPEWHRHRAIEPCGLEQGRKGEGREEEGDVEEAGSEGGHGEPALRVERRHAERGGPHEEDVGEDERRHVRGALELLGVPLVAVGEDVGERAGGKDTGDRDHRQGNERRPARPREEPPRGRLAVLREGLGEHRNEGARHGPFGQ